MAEKVLATGLAVKRRKYNVTFTIKVGNLHDRWVEEVEAFNVFDAVDVAKVKVIEHAETHYKAYDILDAEVERDER